MSHLGVARDLKAFLNFHENANLQLSHSTDQEINCIESKLNIDILDGHFNLVLYFKQN